MTDKLIPGDDAATPDTPAAESESPKSFMDEIVRAEVERVLANERKHQETLGELMQKLKSGLSQKELDVQESGIPTEDTMVKELKELPRPILKNIAIALDTIPSTVLADLLNKWNTFTIISLFEEDNSTAIKATIEMSTKDLEAELNKKDISEDRKYFLEAVLRTRIVGDGASGN